MKKLATVSMTALMTALLVGLVATPAPAQYPPTTTPSDHHPSDHHPSDHHPPRPPPKKPTCGVSDTSISPVTRSPSAASIGSRDPRSRSPCACRGHQPGFHDGGPNGKFSAVVTIPTSVEPGAHTIECSGFDRRGDPVVRGVAVQILGVVGGGGAAFTGTVLNVPLWMLLIAALFAAGVVAVAIGRRRRRSVGTGS